MQMAGRIIVQKNINFFLAYGSRMMLKLLHREKNGMLPSNGLWIVMKVGLARQKIKPIDMKFLNPIKGLAKTMLAFGLVSALGGVSLFAAPIYTLGGLVSSGGTITIGDKTFSGFSYQASGLTSFDASQITVAASESGGIDYLTWSGNMSLVSAGVSTADLLLKYIVTANPGQINMIDQSYTPGNVVNGLLAVDETVAIGAFGGTVVGYSHLDTGDLTDPPAEPVQGDNLNINPAQSVLYVTKDISLGVISPNGGSISITQVEQSFHQVPEPSVTLIGILGGGLLLLLKSCQVRHNLRKP
jgi:hypothetical protein